MDRQQFTHPGLLVGHSAHDVYQKNLNRLSTGSASSVLSQQLNPQRSGSSNRHRSHSLTNPIQHARSNSQSTGIQSQVTQSPPAAQSSPSSQQSASMPPLFVGINLPADRPGVAHPYTDRALVDSAVASDYDMITSRISSPNYRRRIEALFSQAEDAWSVALSAHKDANVHQKQSFINIQQNTSTAPSTPSTFPNTPNGTYPNNYPYSNRPLSSAHSVSSQQTQASSHYHYRSASGASASSASVHKKPKTKKHSQPDLLPFDSIVVPPLELDDILLLPGPHLQNVIALTAPWVELDSKNPRIAALSIQVLVQEIAYAAYCGITYLVVSGPKRRTNVEQYANAVAQILAAAPPYVQIMINLPFAEDDYVSARTNTHVPPADYLSIWDVWNTVRTVTKYPKNLYVALQIPPKSTPFPETVANRWYAEPVKMLTLCAAIFMPNAKKYPVLPKATQNLLFRFMGKQPFLMLADVYDQPARDFSGGIQSYLLYVRHLLRIRPKPSTIESYATGYADLLQLPLQPLADNLENATYEVFERDPIKYALYEKAILAALFDIPKQHVEVAVAGAGRGPLVEKTLNAAAAAGKTVHIYAIEKNSSACIHLARRKEFEWTPENLRLDPSTHGTPMSSVMNGMSYDNRRTSMSPPLTVSSVEVVHADLRFWRPPAGAPRVHLIVSELLGSFGDNELAPECLDSLDTPEVLDPECGIMIPQEYVAWFTPVMSPELYKRAADFKLPGSDVGGSSGNAAFGSSTVAGGPSSSTASSLSPFDRRPGVNLVATSNTSVGSLNLTSSRRHNPNTISTGLGSSSGVFQTPYVVHLNAVDYVAPGQFAKAWTFNHPSPYGSCLASAETAAEAATNAGIESEQAAAVAADQFAAENNYNQANLFSGQAALGRGTSPLSPWASNAPYASSASGSGGHVLGHNRVGSGAAAFRANSFTESGGAYGGAGGFSLAAVTSGGSDSASSSSYTSGSPIATTTTAGSGMSAASATAVAIAAAAAEAAKYAAETAAAVKALFPASSRNMNNTRKMKHTFRVPSQCVIHGLAGYFECRLYGTVGFSTRPDVLVDDSLPPPANGAANPTSSTTSISGRPGTPLSFTQGNAYSTGGGEPEYLRDAEPHTPGGPTSSNTTNGISLTDTAFGIPHTKDMLSWFPIWFPFTQPMYVCGQSEVDIAMWRRTDGSRVWYEWAMESYIRAGKLAPQKLSQDVLEELAKSSAMPINGSGHDYDVDMTDDGHKERMKQVSDKYAELQAKRRVRTGSTELHNAGGTFFSMTL